MKRTSAALAMAALLAGCASPQAYSELQAAEQNLKAHDRADFVLRTQLLESASEARRQAAIQQADHCRTEFRDRFVSLLDSAARRGDDALVYAVGEARRADLAFDACVRVHGLTGRPEFQLGERLLPTPDFVRSYYDAGNRYARAAQAVESESQHNGAAFAAGVGAAGRGMAATYQPQPLPAPTIQQPITCSSYTYGTYVNTTCR